MLAPEDGSTNSSARVEVAADSTAYESSSSRIVVLGFLVASLVAAAIDTIYLARTGRSPNGLVLIATALAVVGLGFASLLRSSTQWERWCVFAVFTAFLAFYGATRVPDPTPYNGPIRQADAFLHGHAWVDAPSHIEQAHFQGKTYLLQPPMAGILMMPLVAIGGLGVDQTQVSVISGALAVALAFLLLCRLGVSPTARVWLVLFFGTGTVLWYEATLGNSWGFVLVVSMLLTLLALIELFGKCRPVVVGLLAGLSGITRFDLVPLWPIWILLVMLRGRRGRELLWTLPGLAFGAAILVAFNEVRFGAPFDAGLSHYSDPFLTAHGGRPFALRFLPFNLYTLLFMAPSHDDVFPYVHPTYFGQSIPLTSPAFVLAFRPTFRSPMPALLFLASLVASIPSLLVYANGFQQFGARYYLQVFPFLLTLIALGLPCGRADQLTKLLVAVSMALVGYGVWHVRTVGFS